MFLKALLHVSMFIHHPQKVYYNVGNLLIICNHHFYKCFYFTHFVNLPGLITDSLMMMYKHRNT